MATTADLAVTDAALRETIRESIQATNRGTRGMLEAAADARAAEIADAVATAAATATAEVMAAQLVNANNHTFLLRQISALTSTLQVNKPKTGGAAQLLNVDIVLRRS